MTKSTQKSQDSTPIPEKIRFLEISIICGIATLDLITKFLVLDLMKQAPYHYTITSFFNIVLVKNTGISFGIFRGESAFNTIILPILTGLLIIWLLRWLYKSPAPVERIALCLIIGGAIGNTLDRTLQGSVTDFLDFHLNNWHWPSFNIADVAIVAGTALMLLYLSYTRQ